MKTPIFLALGLVCLFAGGLVEAHLYLLDGLDGWLASLCFDEDTVYATGYSDAAFRSVHPGMTESELLGRLQTPLGENWTYSSFVPPGTLSEMVCFSGDEVARVYTHDQNIGNLSKVSIGMTKHEVVRLVGEPLEKSFVYTETQHDKSYHVRVVSLAKGIVVRRESSFYVD
jgi:outer membrane protein assembly factor BamE (lipoprotein component of BamABCDE complex)